VGAAKKTNHSSIHSHKQSKNAKTAAVYPNYKKAAKSVQAETYKKPTTTF